MEILPPEILIDIFEFLDFCSLRSASMVCKKWYESSKQISLLDKGRLIFDASLLLDQYADDYDDKNDRDLDDKFDFDVRSSNVTITNLDDDFNSSLFFRNHSDILGHHVKKLTLQNCSIMEKTLLKIIEYCSHLQELELNGCSSLFISATSFPTSRSSDQLESILRNLRHLGISGCNYLSDSILSGMFSLCSDLQSISLPLAHLQFSTRGLSRINSLTFDNLLQNMSISNREITELCLDRTHVTAQALKAMCGIENVNLRKISLRNCNELSNAGVEALVEKQRDLEVLDLSGCSEVSYDVIHDICLHAHKLKVLRLATCMRVQSDSSSQLRHISNLDNLVELNLSDCHSVKIEHLKPVFLYTRLQRLNLKSCDLSYLNQLLTNELQTTGDEPKPGICESLNHLNISSSRSVDDETILLVCAIFNNLQSFDCSWCSQLTDAGILGISKTQYEEKVSDLSNEVLMKCVKRQSLNRLRLTSLNLSSCFSLTTFGMKNLFKYGNFPQLKELQLATNKNSVDDDVICHMANKCPNIQLINIKSCHEITDIALDCMSQHFPHLTSLDVSNCNLITVQGLLKIASKCWWLKQLESCMCGGITSTDTRLLRNHLPQNIRFRSRYNADK